GGCLGARRSGASASPWRSGPPGTARRRHGSAMGRSGSAMAAERRSAVEDIVRRAVAASKAPETEVLVSGGREALTRFAGNAIHQNLSREVIEISIRA